MGRLVYVKVNQSEKGAHQYLQIDGVRVGDIWREHLRIKDAKGNQCEKWRWFARPEGITTVLGEAVSSTGDKGFGSKDRAVDALISAACQIDNDFLITVVLKR